ncbi:MAG: hemerythrin domain-containing protein [Candidatus Omnitrophota bacterium]
MMKPTEILESEHRIIEQVLSCLEKMTDLNEESKKLDCDAARDMIDFFRMFADRFHHAKEEQHLFALLEAHGMPRDGGPTGVMLAEHEMGRGFVGGMEKAVAAYEKGEAEAMKSFVKAARAYVSLLREHIQKEDHCLFAMTNENLSSEEQGQLLKAFRDEEVKIPKGKGHDYYFQKAQDLGNRYQVKSSVVSACAPSSCGHHKPGSCGG